MVLEFMVGEAELVSIRAMMFDFMVILGVVVVVVFGWSLGSWEDGFPIVFHADDGPAVGSRFIETFVESADV